MSLLSFEVYEEGNSDIINRYYLLETSVVQVFIQQMTRLCQFSGEGTKISSSSQQKKKKNP